MPQQNGYLVIADISGYTAFLTQGELEHAEEIMSSIINTLINHMGPPLIISKLEGDAIFAYAPGGNFVQGQTLLEAIEKLYCVFASTMQGMHRNTTCTCKACELIPTLDLKFVTHHGAFILSNIAGREELSGPDVILVHRLLKSEITETTGVKAYAFFTETCTKAMGLGTLTEEMQSHTENYEHLGDVPSYVHNMHTVWANEQEHKRIVVEPENIWFEIQSDIPAPSVIVWDYLTEPDLKQRWLEADSIKVVGTNKGRAGVGTEHHCVHGKEINVQTIVDWRPFEHITYETALPLNGVCRWMMGITPTEAGSKLTVRFGKPTGQGGLGNIIVPIMGLAIKNTVKKDFEQGQDILQQMVAKDLAAGKITVVAQPPIEQLIAPPQH